MTVHILKLASASVLLLICTLAEAIPFSSFDPRAMGMGGTGVAVPFAATAPLYNPALLSITRYSDDFSLALPTAGMSIADSKDLAGSLDRFQNGNYIDSVTTATTSLDAAITAANAAPSAGTMATVSTSAATLSSSLSTLSTQINTLNNKPVTFDGGLSTVIGIPDKKFGFAFYANYVIATGAAFQYKDAALLTGLSTQTNCISTAAANADPNVAKTEIAACGTPVFSNSSLLSGVDLRGVKLGEMGLAFSREFYINRNRVALGITPKYVQADLYDIPIGFNSPSLSSLNSSDYKAQYSFLNFDLGLAQNYRNGWRTGMVIKNIIPYDLDFKRASVTGGTPVATGEKIRLFPQTRLGISHTNNWSTLAMDADLYRNDPAGLENPTQYLSFGAELNARSWGQIRFGYRADLVNSERDITTLGIGFSPFGLHADLAVAWNSHEAGAAFQLGFRF